MTEKIGFAPDREAIAKLATEAIGNLPAPFADHLADVLVRVEDFAEDEILREMGIEDPWELTGLYQGCPMNEQSIWSTAGMPPVISLFRMPLLNEWIECGVTLEDLVVHVLVHEVGHHFGLSDADMEAIENAVG